MFELPNPQNTPVKANLEQFKLTQKQLDKIIEDLMKMIDAIALNPSLLSRASSYWGTRPLWQKISAGILLTAPFFIIGIAANISVLLTISIFTLITYTASSLLLDNHHEHNTDRTEHLKKSVSNLVEVLVAVILSLETLQEQFTLNISELSAQIKTLTEHTQRLNDTAQQLNTTKIDLENTVDVLKGTINEQTQLLNKRQKELENACLKLSEKISELHLVKTAMGLEINKSQKITAVLKETVASLADTVFLDEQQRIAFFKKMNEFLSNKEASFDKIAERICEAERQLSLVTEELRRTKDEFNRCNLYHRQLLREQENLISRLAQLERNKSTDTLITPLLLQTQILKNMGFYAFNEQPDERIAQPAYTPLAVY